MVRRRDGLIGGRTGANCRPTGPERDGLLGTVHHALIEETARHAGHADIIRETLDGSRGI